MTTPLKHVAQLAKQELALGVGAQLFDIPSKQLFDHDSRGELRALPSAQENRRTIATLALDFEYCSRTVDGVELRDSLRLVSGYPLLVDAVGSKLLSAVSVHGDGDLEMIGQFLYMDLRVKDLGRPRCPLPVDMDEALQSLSNVSRFDSSIYLELVCSKPHSGAATLLLLCLVKKLDGAKRGIMTDAINSSSQKFFKTMGFQEINRSPSLWWLPKEEAMRLARLPRSRGGARKAGFLDHLRSPEELESLCTRKGLTRATAHKTYWDCR